jgi:hypothetical protein
MAQCSQCKTETQLHVNGAPVCPACDHMSRSKWKSEMGALKPMALSTSVGAPRSYPSLKS